MPEKRIVRKEIPESEIRAVDISGSISEIFTVLKIAETKWIKLGWENIHMVHSGLQAVSHGAAFYMTGERLETDQEYQDRLEFDENENSMLQKLHDRRVETLRQKAHELGYRAHFCTKTYVTTKRTSNAKEEEAYKNRTTLGIYQALKYANPPPWIRVFYKLLPLTSLLLMVAGEDGMAWMRGIRKATKDNITNNHPTKF